MEKEGGEGGKEGVSMKAAWILAVKLLGLSSSLKLFLLVLGYSELTCLMTGKAPIVSLISEERDNEKDRFS